MFAINPALLGTTVSASLSMFDPSKTGTLCYHTTGLEMRLFRSNDNANMARVEFEYKREHWACWLSVKIEGDRALVDIPTVEQMIESHGAEVIRYFLGARKDDRYHSVGTYARIELAERDAKRWHCGGYETQIQEYPAPLVCWWND